MVTSLIAAWDGTGHRLTCYNIWANVLTNRQKPEPREDGNEVIQANTADFPQDGYGSGCAGRLRPRGAAAGSSAGGRPRALQGGQDRLAAGFQRNHHGCRDPCELF